MFEDRAGSNRALRSRTTTPAQGDLRDPQTYEIIGAAMAVHRALGCGFLESVYHPALALEFASRGVPFASEVKLPIYYRNTLLPMGYRADFICYDAIIIEVKALPSLGGLDDAILLNYLKAAQLQRGLLLNFGAESGVPATSVDVGKPRISVTARVLCGLARRRRRPAWFARHQTVEVTRPPRNRASASQPIGAIL